MKNSFFIKYEDDSKQKNVYNMINSKFEKDKDYGLDGLEDFNNETFEKQKDINIKYNTIQIEKKVPILLSDEAFNRKMKEYQTENFRRKKEFELNDEINKKMSKNGSKKSIKTNNKNKIDENEYLSNKENQDDNEFNNSLEVNINSNKNLNKEEILASPKIEKLENNENIKIEGDKENNKSFGSEMDKNEIEIKNDNNNNDDNQNINNIESLTNENKSTKIETNIINKDNNINDNNININLEENIDINYIKSDENNNINSFIWIFFFVHYF